MTPEQEAFGRRAVACPGWRWMPGMLTTCGLRVIDGGSDGYVVGHRSGATRDGGGWYDGPSDGLTPDLADPATLGCLVALAREALGVPGAFAVYYDGDWTIERDDGTPDREGLHDSGRWGLDGSGDFISKSSEPDAWLAALEAAGRR